MIVVHAIIALLDFVIIYLLSHFWVKKSLKPSLIDLASAILLIIIDYFTNESPINSLLFTQVFIIIYISLFVASNHWDGIILSSITIMTAFAAQVAAALLLVVILKDSGLLNSEYMGILGDSITILIILLLFRFTKIKGLFSHILASKSIYKLILIYTYSISLLVLFWAKTDIRIIYNSIYPLAIVFILLILSNIVVLFYDRKISQKESELDHYKKNLPIYESLIHEIRSNQHEYSNRLQSMESLTVTCSTYEELVSALKDYTREYDKPLFALPLLKINMPLLAASLYNQAARAQSRGIHVQFDVTSTELESTVTETNLTDYATIILQNAVEACKAEDSIYVLISSENGKTSVEVRNPSAKKYTIDEINQFFENGYTTKTSTEKNHSRGKGLYMLRKELAQKGAYLSADCTEFEGDYYTSFKIIV